jgi:nuclear pore complex protein Nup155
VKIHLFQGYIEANLEYLFQVLGLWQIVSDHQLHVLEPHLPIELRRRLPSITFKELILSGNDVCSGMLSGLVSLYLADDASVDAISDKLRSTCPSLFCSKDSAAAKAKQLLQQAQEVFKIFNPDLNLILGFKYDVVIKKSLILQEKVPSEKQSIVEAALRLLQEAAPHVDLPNVCQQLLTLQSYEGVVRVCAACAKAVDPYDFGMKHYMVIFDIFFPSLLIFMFLTG